MKRADVLAILDGKLSDGSDNVNGKPVTFLATASMDKCITALNKLAPSKGSKTRPVMLDPQQMPPIF